MASRGVRVFGLLVGLVLVLGGCGWPMYRFDPGRTGFNRSETVIGTSNVGSLHQIWAGTIVGGTESSAVVVGGVAYIGATNGKLYAFDASGRTGCSGTPKTCAPLWVGVTGGEVFSTPAVVNGWVFVGSNDGNVYAFYTAAAESCPGSPPTCHANWVAPTGGIVDSSPMVVNDVVYVGSVDGKMYALRTADGVRLWSAATGDKVVSSPAVVDGIVYIGSQDHRLYAFDAAGVEGCGGSPKTCQPLWTATLGEPPSQGINSSPAVANGVVYIGSGDDKLYAFDAAGKTNCSGTRFTTCEPLWTAMTQSVVESSPAVANGVVYVGSLDGNLYAFDAAGTNSCSGVPKTCAPLWTAPTGGPIQYSSPAVANGVVYVEAWVNIGSANLYAFDAAGASGCGGSPKTCTPLRTLGVGGFGVSSPTVANGVVYIGSPSEGLVAFAR